LTSPHVVALGALSSSANPLRARVNAGIARAKAAGKHCGRPPLAPELAERIREALAVPGRPGIRVIAKQFGVSPMTVQNVAR
jgi:DNA invertase Pin-like site-specific DNA recombinase